jgi:hypothetical protein
LQRPDALEERTDVDALGDVMLRAAHNSHLHRYRRSWTGLCGCALWHPNRLGHALGRTVDIGAGAARHWKPLAYPEKRALPSDSVDWRSRAR